MGTGIDDCVLNSVCIVFQPAMTPQPGMIPPSGPGMTSTVARGMQGGMQQGQMHAEDHSIDYQYVLPY